MNREHFHPHDPETFEPLDSELLEDDDLSDAEREAQLADEHFGNDLDNR